MTPHIQIQHVSKSYGSKRAIHDISFDVGRHEIVAILGPSGCGKTTLLKSLLGLEQPTRGTILLDAQPQQEWLARHRIAYVPQRYANFAHLTVEQNILTAQKHAGHVNHSAVKRLLKNVGLDRHAHAYPSQLSGGMQQRLALARALAQDTDIIAFDESLNSLDVETRHQMQELLLELWAEHPKTIVFVTHDIEEALFLSHRVVVMGTSPGVVREVIDVPFRYPRQSTLRYDEQFQQMRRALAYIIRSESIKGKLSEGALEQSSAIKIGLYYWPGNSPLFYAHDTGLFDSHGQTVELLSFTDHHQKLEYWKSGALDVVNVTMDTALGLQKEMPDVEIIAGLNISNGGDALISRGSIENVRDLKGKTIALEKGAISEFFLQYILDQHGLSMSDVRVQDMKGDEIGAALIHGTVDAAVLWEPWLSKALELSRARVIVTSTAYPVFADVLIAKSAFIQTHPEFVPFLRAVWNLSVQAFHRNPKEFIYSVAPLVGLSSQDLEQQLKKITFLDGSTTEVSGIGKRIQHLINSLGVQAKKAVPTRGEHDPGGAS